MNVSSRLLNLPSNFTPNNVPKCFDLETRVSDVVNVQILKSGFIRMKPSEDAGNKKSCIYVIWNTLTRMTYIGKTDQMFKKRLSQHAYCANHPGLDSGNSKLYQSLRKDPVNFRFGLINLNSRVIVDPDDLSKKEKEEIKKIPLKFRLNSNIGGGGGTSSKITQVKVDVNKVKAEVFDTPKKYYPLKIKSKKISFDLTPGITKVKDAVYVIKNIKNDKRYIGFTTQLVKNRLSQHVSKANRKRGLFTDQKIYREIKSNPEHFEAGVLAKNVNFKNLPDLEKEFISKKRAYTNGYNCNQGGGGSVATKKAKI